MVAAGTAGFPPWPRFLKKFAPGTDEWPYVAIGVGVGPDILAWAAVVKPEPHPWPDEDITLFKWLDFSNSTCWTDTVGIIQDSREWQKYSLQTHSLAREFTAQDSLAQAAGTVLCWGSDWDPELLEVTQRAWGAAFPASPSCSCFGCDRGTVYTVHGSPVCAPAGDDCLQMPSFLVMPPWMARSILMGSRKTSGVSTFSPSSCWWQA